LQNTNLNAKLLAKFSCELKFDFIPKPVWAIGFALEQTLRDATLAVFSFANFKTASVYVVCFLFGLKIVSCFIFLEFF
jgi:hypothetical protein